MKTETLRSATEAHGWIGVIISVALFIVFWAGSVTLFYPELSRWAALPHFPISESEETKGLNDIIASTLEKYEFDNRRRLSVFLPGEHSPYLKVNVPVFDASVDHSSKGKVAHSEYEFIVLQPDTGEVLFDHDTFHLADFLYEFHYNLKLPMGLYIVGVVTLFFFVILLTGIVIQIQKMVKNFFLYRHESTPRNRFTDMHNVVGVISIPYTVMYALTGVILNLGIVAQTSNMFLLYQGDREAMLHDVGFYSAKEKPAEVARRMPDLGQIILDVSNEENAQITMLNVMNFGDENAVIRVSGRRIDQFKERFNFYYKVDADGHPQKVYQPNDNAFAKGISLVFNLHFANFAGLDVRFVYFLLGIGVCGMIVVGNILWVIKREKRTKKYGRSVRVVRAFTLGGCVGVVLATSVAFLFERVLPLNIEHRGHVVEWLFILVLFVSMMWAWFVKNEAKFIGAACFMAAMPLLSIGIYDVLILRSSILFLLEQGEHAVFGVTCSLLIIAVFFLLVGRRLLTFLRQGTSQ